MRLTTKYLESENYFADEISEDATEEELNEYLHSIITKLGKLEDIEDKLGVDLITFFKILDGKKLYGKDSNGRIYEMFTVQDMRCFFDEGAFIAYDPYYNSMQHDKRCYLHLKDYGKTWALTKEELL